MKTAIVYYSEHHGNTKKLIDAIAARNEVTLINVMKDEDVDLSEFDLVGFASGIYYFKFNKKVCEYARRNLTKEGAEVFFLYTYGGKRDGYLKSITAAVSEHSAKVLGSYGCTGFDTYGPFKLVGGVEKGHPDENDIAGAVKFYDELISVKRGNEE